MSAENQAAKKGTCFVVMGFGKKTDFETGRTLDLDKTYRNIIKPSVEAAGLKCVRADEIVHSGLIDVPMYEQLLNADVVVADLSTSNKNAYYELGVRHALKPYTTIIICEDAVTTFPFDIKSVSIRQYRHMESGIDYEEVLRFREVLTKAIAEIYNSSPRQTDSPIYSFLKGLTPPEMKEAMDEVAEAVAGVAPASNAKPPPGEAAAPRPDTQTHSALMQEVDDAQRRGDFVTAKSLLNLIRKKMSPAAPEYSYITQRLALVTYKSELPTPEAALEEARELLLTLNPATSNDTETLGLWGAAHKRLWLLTKDPGHLNEAVRAYERGFHLRNDYYNGINLAFLLNVRAALSCRVADSAASPEEARRLRADAVACFVHAGKIRREVLDICGRVLGAERVPAGEKYWASATMAEAYLGIGDEARAEQKLREALAAEHSEWMEETTREQMDELRRLLADSPLKYVSND